MQIFSSKLILKKRESYIKLNKNGLQNPSFSETQRDTKPILPSAHKPNISSSEISSKAQVIHRKNTKKHKQKETQTKRTQTIHSPLLSEGP